MNKILVISSLVLLTACGGGGGSSSPSVAPPAATPTPTIALASSVPNAAVASPISLTWTGQNDSGCAASGNWTGQLASSGSQSVTPTTTGINTYTITCGAATATTTVNVLPQYTAIPDPVFQAALAANGITVTNGQINTADALGVTKLEITFNGSISSCNPPAGEFPVIAKQQICYIVPANTYMQSASGIESFVNLNFLDLDGQQIPAINLNSLTQLTWLSLWMNPLTTIDVSKNTALTQLGLSETSLTTVDTSTLVNLTQAFFQNYDSGEKVALPYTKSNGTVVNGFTSLDFTKNVNLQDLDVDANLLTAIDLSKNPALVHLFARSNNFTSMDLSNNNQLTWIYLDYNNLGAVNLTGITLINPTPGPCISADTCSVFTATNNPNLVIQQNESEAATMQSFIATEAAFWNLPEVPSNTIYVVN